LKILKRNHSPWAFIQHVTLVPELFHDFVRLSVRLSNVVGLGPQVGNLGN